MEQYGELHARGRVLNGPQAQFVGHAEGDRDEVRGGKDARGGADLRPIDAGCPLWHAEVIEPYASEPRPAKAERRQGLDLNSRRVGGSRNELVAQEEEQRA